MITPLKDEMEKTKCEKYWPDQDKSLHVSEFEVFNSSEVALFNGSLIKRTFDLKFHNNQTQETEVKKNIVHLQYVTWPDFGVPEEGDYKVIDEIV